MRKPTRTLWVWGLAVLPLAWCLTAAYGEDAPRERDRGTSDKARVAREAQRAGVPVVRDGELATWLVIDNRGEIALARFAQDRADSQAVRDFAKQLDEDHTAFVRKLRDVASAQVPAVAGPRDGDEDDRPAPRVRKRDRDRNREQGRREAPPDPVIQTVRDVVGTIRQVAGDLREGAQEVREDAREIAAAVNAVVGGEEEAIPRPARLPEAGEGDTAPPKVPAPFHGPTPDVPAGLLALKQELGVRFTDSAKKSLGKKEGAAFDIAYLEHQILMHQQMLDTLQVFRKNAGSDEFKALLEEGEQTTRQHLKTARRLFEQTHQHAE